MTKIMTNSAPVVPVVLEHSDYKPAYAKPGDAGADLRSTLDVVIPPGKKVFIPTGVSIQLPQNCFGMVAPRSGLAKKHSITITNAPGTIDSGYRGEIGVDLINLGEEEYRVSRGERIAQLLIVPFVSVVFFETDSLEESDRGTGGFGSTGSL